MAQENGPDFQSFYDRIISFQAKAQRQIPEGADKGTVTVEAAAYEAAVERHKVKTDARRADTEMRGKYAEQAFELARLAVWFWIILFGATAISNAAMGKPALSDKALIALTSGATINVIAVCMVVVRGLFPPRTRREKRSG